VRQQLLKVLKAVYTCNVKKILFFAADCVYANNLLPYSWSAPKNVAVLEDVCLDLFIVRKHVGYCTVFQVGGLTVGTETHM
jgi:hypothetical protein